MTDSEPGREAPGAAHARLLSVSAMTHVYWHAGKGHRQLDHALVTDWPAFASFEELCAYVLERLRYPHEQAHKMETHAWVPTLYAPTVNIGRGHREADVWRCGEAEADALSCWYADIDNKLDDRPHVSEAMAAAGLASLLLGKPSVEHFTYTSFSHTPGRRKVRLVAATDRDVTRAESADLFVLINEVVLGGQGDASIYDAGDMIYAPPHRTEITVTNGVPLPIDALLERARRLKAERPELSKPFQKQAKPVRAAAPEELAAMHARIADRSAREGFGGIDDPAVFNPAWRGDYPMTAVQGSHYATMLSLLGRVWRKTGGRLSYGEMHEVFDQIDALGGFYMARNYPPEKPHEMLRFVMSQPVIDDARPNADAFEWRMRRFKNDSFNKKV